MTLAPAAALMVRHDKLAAREIAIEHGALTRQLASLQRRVGEQLRAHVLQVALLEEEVLFLRAQLVLARTCMLWGLGAAASVLPVPRRARKAVTAPVDTMAEASSVICQTGCVGHAHPWLQVGGQCRRTGQACGLYADSEGSRNPD
ncbi:MAG: hypothetical protein K5880_08340 [Hydrogenophaga sp.]|jgi:hypothetical protein|uniref:hypothetical protein n=1 Tax=Hydrogenophaga sp. TaxID=1904254 RepID=UPI002630F234|nr:hypothetical protein [Hydrogenophaga sp.]MCV0438629.1 hypothetical protein [Hydrogenophaga sp.]